MRIPMSELRVGDLLRTGRTTAYEVTEIIEFEKRTPWSVDRYCAVYRTANRNNYLNLDGHELVEVDR